MACQSVYFSLKTFYFIFVSKSINLKYERKSFSVLFLVLLRANYLTAHITLLRESWIVLRMKKFDTLFLSIPPIASRKKILSGNKTKTNEKLLFTMDPGFLCEVML